MSDVFNIYCDESCHLEHDGQNVMVLGALWCPLEKTREIAQRIREKKIVHGLSPSFEIKWTKISPAKVDFYFDVLDYFFDDDDLHFRAWIVTDKSRLRHSDFQQDHDTWYYKMMFGLLNPLLKPGSRYRIYLDKKDTRSAEKVVKLQEVLCNSVYDFDHKIIERIQVVMSHHVEQLQLTDMLIGAVSYANRGCSGNSGKEALIARMRDRSKYSLIKRTLLGEQKVNLFVHRPKEVAS